MDPVKDIRHDHAELRTLSHQIVDEGAEPKARDHLFRDYRRQVDQHLRVVEQVLLKGELRQAYGKDTAAELRTEHQAVRKALGRLARRRRKDRDWTTEFRAFTATFDQLCRRHETLMDRATARMSPEVLDRRYAKAREEAARRRRPVGPLLAIAALGGAAYAVNRLLEAKRIREEEDWAPRPRAEPGAIAVVETEVVVVEPVSALPADSEPAGVAGRM